MASPFQLSPDFFQQGSLTRPLGGGKTWGYVIVGTVDHGSSPSKGWEKGSRFALNYLIRGTGRFWDSQGREHRLREGSLYHHFPETKAHLELDPAARCAEFFLLCDADTYEGLRLLQFIPEQEVLSTHGNQLVLEAFDRFHHLCSRPPREVSRRQIATGFIDFLSMLYELALQSQAASPWQELVHAAAQQLEEKLEEKIDLPALARHYGVSYASFRREFKRIMHVAPAEYRIRRRIEAACRLLPRLSVKEVSEQLGYCDAFTFSSQFKAFTGMPPSRFRPKAAAG
jgi:AraC-like DNA-binding protein